MTTHTLEKFHDDDPEMITLEGDLSLDPQITCNILYDTTVNNTFNETIMVKTKSFIDYEFNETTHKIDGTILESGARDSGYMIVKKGYPNIMHVKINEITQNLVESNGKMNNLFHMYFTEENHNDDTPFRVN